jgi:hypothetical protein
MEQQVFIEVAGCQIIHKFKIKTSSFRFRHLLTTVYEIWAMKCDELRRNSFYPLEISLVEQDVLQLYI